MAAAAPIATHPAARAARIAEAAMAVEAAARTDSSKLTQRRRDVLHLDVELLGVGREPLGREALERLSQLVGERLGERHEPAGDLVRLVGRVALLRRDIVPMR